MQRKTNEVLSLFVFCLVFFMQVQGFASMKQLAKKKRALIKQAEQEWEDTKVIKCHFI